MLTSARELNVWIKKNFVPGLQVTDFLSIGSHNSIKYVLDTRGLGVRADGWSEKRRVTAAEQIMLSSVTKRVLTIDGLIGPATLDVLEEWQNIVRSKDYEDPVEINKPVPSNTGFTWPRQKDMRKFYGEPGENHTTATLPFPFRIAWDPEKIISKITINEKCAASFVRIQTAVFEKYGMSKIKEYGFDLFGGCYNNRNMRGGTALSTHAFACSIDVDPIRNQLRWGRNQAFLARPECKDYIDCYEAEGWVSLGRVRNYDWMHFQAARL